VRATGACLTQNYLLSMDLCVTHHAGDWCSKSLVLICLRTHGNCRYCQPLSLRRCWRLRWTCFYVHSQIRGLAETRICRIAGLGSDGFWEGADVGLGKEPRPQRGPGRGHTPRRVGRGARPPGREWTAPLSVFPCPGV
jgi:hypothetical protein